MIVDDSIVVRKVLEDVLSEDPDLEVCGVATNGRKCVDNLSRLAPDVVILDIEMPVMNGLEALAAIRKINRSLPVIMFSTLTERGASATLEALSLGATDYATKPTSVGRLEDAKKIVRKELVPKLKSICGRSMPAAAPRATVKRRTASRAPVPIIRKRFTGVEAVLIGVSTGGPKALDEVIPAIPATLKVPILIVQHMPPLFTKFLAERLNEKSSLQVAEVVDGARPEPGQVWIARGDHHVEVEQDESGMVLRENRNDPENSCRPSADVLFRSACQVYGPNLLAVVMTGMGQDGLAGCELIRKAGGQVVVQDEATSVVWGMPGAVARAGAADAVVPLRRIKDEIDRRAGSGRSSDKPLARSGRAGG